MTKKKLPLSKPIMIRMDEQMRARVETVARANGLNTSEIIRLSVSRQLPSLMSGQTKLAAS
jgi:hypothetical protein